MQPPDNAADWYRIENSAENADETDLLIYDSIGGWFGLYADDLIRDLGEITTSKINIKLNSPGGSVFEGIAIANAIRSHPAHVTVYVDSLAASIASVIMLAGDRVLMQPQSQVMIHNASGGCYGDATEMTKMADLLDKQSRNIAEAYAEHTGRPVDEFLAYMAEETWFTAKEAVAIGLADEALPMKPKQPAPASAPEPVEARMHRSWDLSMYRYAGREQAPEPVVAVMAQAGQQAVAEHVRRLHEIADTATTVKQDETSGTVTIDFNLLAADQAFKDLIRDLVDQALTAASTTPGEPVVDQAPAQPDDSPAAPDNASPPPFPPEEEEEEEEGDEPPPDEEDEPTDQADDWSSVVGLLVSPTSPSADDVFAQLKEGWI